MYDLNVLGGQNMKADLYKRFFRAIYAEDIISLKKIAYSIIQSERGLGHNRLADDLEKIAATERPKSAGVFSTAAQSICSLSPTLIVTNSNIIWCFREILKKDCWQ